MVPYLSPEDALWREIASIAWDEGLLLYDLERRGGSSLRVFIDKEGLSSVESPKGSPRDKVTSDDCSRMCRRLMVFFLAEGKRFGVPSEPDIEVSSPGVNRELRLPIHYERSIGERIRVTLSGGAGSGRSRFGGDGAGGGGLDRRETQDVRREKVSITGELRNFSGGEVTVVDETDGEVVTFPLSRVKRAHVAFNFG